MKYRRPAFTFVELLLALTVFSIGMISALKVFPLSKRYIAQSALTTQAVNLAQEQIETLHTLPYAGITSALEPLHYLSTSGAYSQFQRRTSVQLIDSAYQPTATDIGLKQVTVDVLWKENLSVDRQVTLHTFVYRK